jgi:hypothetical protein
MGPNPFNPPERRIAGIMGIKKTKPNTYRKNADSAAGMRVPANLTSAVTPTNRMPVMIIQPTPIRGFLGADMSVGVATKLSFYILNRRP